MGGAEHELFEGGEGEAKASDARGADDGEGDSYLDLWGRDDVRLGGAEDRLLIVIGCRGFGAGDKAGSHEDAGVAHPKRIAKFLLGADASGADYRNVVGGELVEEDFFREGSCVSSCAVVYGDKAVNSGVDRYLRVGTIGYFVVNDGAGGSSPLDDRRWFPESGRDKATAVLECDIEPREPLATVLGRAFYQDVNSIRPRCYRRHLPERFGEGSFVRKGKAYWLNFTENARAREVRDEVRARYLVHRAPDDRVASAAVREEPFSHRTSG